MGDTQAHTHTDILQSISRGISLLVSCRLGGGGIDAGRQRLDVCQTKRHCFYSPPGFFPHVTITAPNYGNRLNLKIKKTYLVT